MQLSDKIKEVVRIEDLANRTGYPVQRNGFCFSIFKQEKTPSLKLHPDTNSFYDYSSAQGGDCFSWVMGLYNVGFTEAVKILGDMYGITYGQSDWKNMPVPVKTKRQSFENIFECMSDDERIMYEERAGLSDEKQALIEVQKHRIENNAKIFDEFYMYCMERGFSKQVYSYLTDERMLSHKAIHYFKLFFISNYFEVNNHLKKRFDINDLLRSGLYNRKCTKCQKDCYTVEVCECGGTEFKSNLIFYNHRLIIPYIYNGKIVYLRGRYFDDSGTSKTTSNKYLGLKNDALGVNTPKRFYNADSLRNIIPGEKIYITEGEFDAMLLEDVWQKNTIAIPGVGNLPAAEKFKVLSKADVVVCPDNDEAGQKMLDNIQRIFKDMGKQVYVKRFADVYKDVTDFIKSITIDELIEEIKK